ncbi:MAG: hypothetical protein JW863_00675 [Chitinispirillaceae bacterium]|nr:hypothetical protein [Chitinispirillaceae bacterium]
MHSSIFSHGKLFLRCTAVLLVLLSYPATAEIDSTKQVFLDSLELTLRNDYRLCSGDSALRPLDELLKWKKTIDRICTDTTYPAIIRKFAAETGINPVDVRPCEIIRWYQDIEAQSMESTRLLELERKKAIAGYKDSIRLEKELRGTIRAPYDLKGIPFGLSQRCFITIAKRNGLPPLINEERIFRYDNFPFGIHRYKAAFHFNSDKRYWCYELESPTVVFDSLNAAARPQVDYLAAQLESATGRGPDHVYRVGQFDIVPGRLSICRMWNLDHAVAYVGLARTGNRFYAKTIVQAKDLSHIDRLGAPPSPLPKREGN